MRRALATVRAHPRHLVLGAFVAGLLAAPVTGAAVAAAATAAVALAGRPRLAAIAAAALIAGALFADARLNALDAGVLHAATGRHIESRAVLLEPVRERPIGPAVARVRLLDGLGAGEQAVLRFTGERGASEPRADSRGGAHLGGPAGGPGMAAGGGSGVAGGSGPGVAGGGRLGVADTGGLGVADTGGLGVARASGPGRAGASDRGEAWPEVGDIVAINGTVGPLGFADAYQRRRNAHAAIDAEVVHPTGRRRGGLAGALDGVRRRAERGLAQGLRPPEAALLRGMVLGEDERLSEDVRDDFQRSGLAHILAVSGQNVVLLIVLVLAACAFTGVPLRTRLVLAAAVVVLYVPLTGGGPSIQRAGVMGVAGLIAALAGRPARRWYALLLAAAATLMLNPRAAGEPGWQLSFAAVAALLVGAAPLRGVLARRMPVPLADASAITIAATIGTAPLMALHFEQLSPAALPANLLAAPAIAPVMWLGVLAAAAGQIAAPLALPFTTLTAPLLVYLQGVANTTAATPVSSIELAVPPAVILPAWAALLGVGALAVRQWRRVRARGGWSALLGVAPDRAACAGGESPLARRLRVTPPGARLASGAAVVLAAAGLVIALNGAEATPPKPGELVVSFLDVGQGDATLIQLGATSVLVDTGPPEGPILKRLQQAHVKRLDALFLTHAESDHEGAALAVIAAYAPRLVVDGGTGWDSAVQRALPAALAAKRSRAVAPQAGRRIDVGALRFTILWPKPNDAPPGGNPNDHAIVARLTHGHFSMLLTADAESHITNPLALEPVDVLKVAHHGSADSGLPELLKRLTPRVAAIEVGRENRYGHPTKSTLLALRRTVPRVVRTDQDGTVRLRVDGDRLQVQR